MGSGMALHLSGDFKGTLSLWCPPLPETVVSVSTLCAHSYSHNALFEVAAEGVGLVVLDLAVLHGAAPQVVIQLCGVDGRAALLILGGVLPDPKVDVLGEKAAHSPGLGCSQRGRVRSQLTSGILLTSPVWGGPSMPCPKGPQGKAPPRKQPFFLCTGATVSRTTRSQAH